MKSLKIIAALVIAVFGIKALTNAHLAYLRTLSLWTVKLVDDAGTSGATGFVAKGKSGKKYIITNAHVCGLANKNGAINAVFLGRKYVVPIVKKYEYHDLCAVGAPEAYIPAVNIGYWVTKGEQVFAIGHPLLEPKTVTSGELSGKVVIPMLVKLNPAPGECKGPTYREVPGDGVFFASACIRLLVSDASTTVIHPGNSGSPIVNIYGSVVGVAFAANEAGTRSYIVPLEALKDFLKEL